MTDPNKPYEPDDFDDLDDNPDEEDEQFPIPQALLDAAGVTTDEEYEAIPEAKPSAPVLARLGRARKP